MAAEGLLAPSMPRVLISLRIEAFLCLVCLSIKNRQTSRSSPAILGCKHISKMSSKIVSLVKDFDLSVCL